MTDTLHRTYMKGVQNNGQDTLEEKDQNNTFSAIGNSDINNILYFNLFSIPQVVVNSCNCLFKYKIKSEDENYFTKTNCLRCD